MDLLCQTASYQHHGSILHMDWSDFSCVWDLGSFDMVKAVAVAGADSGRQSAELSASSGAVCERISELHLLPCLGGEHWGVWTDGNWSSGGRSVVFMAKLAGSKACFTCFSGVANQSIPEVSCLSDIPSVPSETLGWTWARPIWFALGMTMMSTHMIAFDFKSSFCWSIPAASVSLSLTTNRWSIVYLGSQATVGGIAIWMAGFEINFLGRRDWVGIRFSIVMYVAHKQPQHLHLPIPLRQWWRDATFSGRLGILELVTLLEAV